MIYVYAGMLFLLLLLSVLAGKYQKERFRELKKKEHPLRLLYPAAAKVIDVRDRIFPGAKAGKARALLKSLYIKENIEEEVRLYRVKKTAAVLAVLMGASLFGVLFCLSQQGVETIRSLERSQPGQGTRSYELEVDYQGQEETLQIPVEAREYSEEEVLALFESSIDPIKEKLLGENESFSEVSKPLSFFTDYNGIKIFWEIGDPDLVGYNGEIKVQPEEGESQIIHLFARLSLGDVSRMYHIPARLTAPQLSDTEKLLAQIQEEVAANNRVQDAEVSLPEQINGSSITFRKVQENRSVLLLILGLLSAVIIAILYDRQLENRVKKRREQLLLDFSQIVSKLSLLYDAGASIRKAWEKIVADQEEKGTERFAYQEMKLALEKIKSGVSEKEAYLQFAQRCGLHPYIKLGNILEQNLSKGARGMSMLLKQEAADAFETRKRLARKKGEEASTKLLIPMILMLLVVVAIIAVPALMSINI